MKRRNEKEGNQQEKRGRTTRVFTPETVNLYRLLSFLPSFLSLFVSCLISEKKRGSLEECKEGKNDQSQRGEKSRCG